MRFDHPTRLCTRADALLRAVALLCALVWCACGNGDVAQGHSDEDSASLFAEPVSTIRIGETNILTTDDSGNSNLLVAQAASLGQTATIQSMSFYVTTAAGKLRLGIYDATGPGGGPGAKKAETAEITPVASSWNTANVLAPVLLAPGTYWLVYLPSNDGLGFRKVSGTINSKFYNFPYGTMPTAFSTSPNSTASHWSFYATLTTSAAIRIGETNILTTDDSGNSNLLVAQAASLGQTATIQSMSFYVTTAAGKLRLGIYDATGPGGGPGAKKAETAEITPVASSWNTANVVTPVSLAPGTYWLAYLPSNDGLGFRKVSGTVNSKFHSFAYGTMPAAFSTSPNSTASHWSFYATLSPSGTTDTTAPAAPSSLVAAASGASQINLTWTASTDNVGVTGYRVERCQGTSCTSFAQVAAVSGNSYSDTGLSASTTYSYRVRATDAAGNLSAYSNIAGATTGASSGGLASGCGAMKLGTQGSLTCNSPTNASGCPALGGVDPLSPSDPLRADVSGWAVSAESNAQKCAMDNSLCGNPNGTSSLHWRPDGMGQTAGTGSIYIGHNFTIVDNTQPMMANVIGSYASESDPSGANGFTSWWPAVPGMSIEGFDDPTVSTSADRHGYVVNRGSCFLYESYASYYNATTHIWNSAFLDNWDLLNREDRPYEWTSVDAAGLPVWPLLVKYEESCNNPPTCTQSNIHHAIRVAPAVTRRAYTPPATHYTTSGPLCPNGQSGTNCWPIMGSRWRLKASFDCSAHSFPQIVVNICNAAKKYGVIVADNEGMGAWAWMADGDPRWTTDLWDNTYWGAIAMSDFEEVLDPNYTVGGISVRYGPEGNTATPTGTAPTISSFLCNGLSACTIASGQSAALSWSVSGTGNWYLDIDNKVGAVRGSSVTSPPITATTTFTLSATNRFGRTTRAVTVTVQ